MTTPNKITELIKLAKAADDAGHSATAFELFRQVVTLDPKKDIGIYRAVKNLLEIGRISDAENFLGKIRRNTAPKSWLIELVLGQIRLAQFRPTDAETHFRRAWTLRDDSTVPAIFLADCLLRLEKFDDAENILIDALKVKGDLDEVYVNLGLVNRAKGNYKRARQYLLNAIEITPDYESAKRVLADVEHWLSVDGKTDEAT